uniref:NADH-ubiquinone oxidoreductase chain 3 n=1 Tax=Eurythenes maldoror TaxID=1836943 RepID=A0A343RBC3_9CRUS|nr:NADH dehydrogenase subunit 3 [Eurythenes maldoror]ATX68766.1 NADH dehydrogenase subunit 3 [Eurythenes maldoror]
MHLLLTLSFISLMIATLMAAVALITSKKSTKDREKLSPFECGFDPLKKARTPFSLRFFMVTILFLIFDVEIALLLPLGVTTVLANPTSIIMAALILTLILILGLLHEWNQGALNWAL